MDLVQNLDLQKMSMCKFLNPHATTNPFFPISYLNTSVLIGNFLVFLDSELGNGNYNDVYDT